MPLVVLLTCSEDSLMTYEVNFLRLPLFTHFILCSVSPPSPVPGTHPCHASDFPSLPEEECYSMIMVILN